MDLCILKKCLGSRDEENPLAGISHFHWNENLTNFPGIYTRQELYKFIRGGGYAYIIDPADPFGQKRLPLTVAKTKKGTKYVRTILEGWETDHLLNLPDCES